MITIRILLYLYFMLSVYKQEIFLSSNISSLNRSEHLLGLFKICFLFLIHFIIYVYIKDRNISNFHFAFERLPTKSICLFFICLLQIVLFVRKSGKISIMPFESFDKILKQEENIEKTSKDIVDCEIIWYVCRKLLVNFSPTKILSVCSINKQYPQSKVSIDISIFKSIS